ncbi:hypothetical protein GCM10025864_22050 [Luteimicrobium album]|uniref:Aminotransferase class I/classII domain-containing protein n=1 Tax=Luteimicrobium album TaxID=1054550 RepID=A0ABQ6I107_9MICO|nr:hypothetical protein [Luteimicrobium album]GMA24446.1 hypothetical protein GCM10025864_22050 [Luteimicrobium album]
MSELRNAFATVLADPEAGPLALAYSGGPGDPRLRELIAAREGVDPARVVITNGGLHGISLVLESLVDEGDVVAVESPTYPLTLRVLGRSARGSCQCGWTRRVWTRTISRPCSRRVRGPRSST